MDNVVRTLMNVQRKQTIVTQKLIAPTQKEVITAAAEKVSWEMDLNAEVKISTKICIFAIVVVLITIGSYFVYSIKFLNLLHKPNHVLLPNIEDNNQY